ncbi:MAG: GNAT family protein [Armatimonadota bacterium]
MNLINFLFPNTIKWPELTGNRIYMAHFDNKYIENLRAFLADPHTVKLAFGISGDFNRSKIAENYIMQVKQSAGKTLSIFSKNDASFIGVAHISFVNFFSKNYKFGILLGDKNYQDKGLGRDCVYTVLEYLFENKKVNSVTLETADFNHRARKCFEVCGFKKISAFRDFDETARQYSNKILYKITKEEYLGKTQIAKSGRK